MHTDSILRAHMFLAVFLFCRIKESIVPLIDSYVLVKILTDSLVLNTIRHYSLKNNVTITGSQQFRNACKTLLNSSSFNTEAGGSISGLIPVQRGRLRTGALTSSSRDNTSCNETASCFKYGHARLCAASSMS